MVRMAGLTGVFLVRQEKVQKENTIQEFLLNIMLCRQAQRKKQGTLSSGEIIVQVYSSRTGKQTDLRVSTLTPHQCPTNTYKVYIHIYAFPSKKTGGHECV